VQVIFMYKKIVLLVVLAMVAGCSDGVQGPDKIVLDTENHQQAVIVSEEIIDTNEEGDNIPEVIVDETEEDEDADESNLNENIEADLEVQHENLPDEVIELIEKSESITSLNYYYDSDQYFVSDNKIHIVLDENIGSLGDDNLYNNVFINLDKNKTYVWCTDSTYCGSKTPQVYWEIDSGEFDVITPVERLQALTNAKIINEDMSCENRKRCMEIEFRDSDGIDKNMWIYTYNPVVWKVEWHDASKGKDFIDLYQAIILRVDELDMLIPEEFGFVKK